MAVVVCRRTEVPTGGATRREVPLRGLPKPLPGMQFPLALRFSHHLVGILVSRDVAVDSWEFNSRSGGWKVANMAEQWQLFVAIDLGEEARRALGEAQAACL